MSNSNDSQEESNNKDWAPLLNFNLNSSSNQYKTTTLYNAETSLGGDNLTSIDRFSHSLIPNTLNKLNSKIEHVRPTDLVTPSAAMSSNSYSFNHFLETGIHQFLEREREQTNTGNQFGAIGSTQPPRQVPVFERNESTYDPSPYTEHDASASLNYGDSSHFQLNSNYSAYESNSSITHFTNLNQTSLETEGGVNEEVNEDFTADFNVNFDEDDPGESHDTIKAKIYLWPQDDEINAADHTGTMLIRREAIERPNIVSKSVRQSVRDEFAIHDKIISGNYKYMKRNKTKRMEWAPLTIYKAFTSEKTPLKKMKSRTDKKKPFHYWDYSPMNCCFGKVIMRQDRAWKRRTSKLVKDVEDSIIDSEGAEHDDSDFDF